MAILGGTVDHASSPPPDAVPQPRLKRVTVVFRNKQQVVRESGILIAVLEEALNFQPTARGNTPTPELRLQLKLEDRDRQNLFKELLAELKKLNAFLEANRAPRAADKKAIGDLKKVGLKVLKTYGNTVAVGAGLLTIGALSTLLTHIGAGEIVESAMIWKKLGH